MKKSLIIATTVVGLTTAIFAYGMGPGGDKCGGMDDSRPMMERGMGPDGGKCGGMHKGMKDHMRKDPMLMVFKELNLTDTQKEALQKLREEEMEENKAVREKMMEAGKKRRTPPDLSKVMTANTFDKAAFKAQMLQEMEQRDAMMKENREAMLEKRADHMQKVFEILTPEQRTKWLELSKEKAK